MILPWLENVIALARDLFVDSMANISAESRCSLHDRLAALKESKMETIRGRHWFTCFVLKADIMHGHDSLQESDRGLLVFSEHI